MLKAKCDAPIRVELIDRTTGQPITEDLPDVVLEVKSPSGGGGAGLPLCGVAHARPAPAPRRRTAAATVMAAAPGSGGCGGWQRRLQQRQLRRQRQAAVTLPLSPSSKPPFCTLLPGQMCVLDGNAYDTKLVEAGEEREEDLESCALLLNNKAQALLAAGPGERQRRMATRVCVWVGGWGGGGFRREGPVLLHNTKVQALPAIRLVAVPRLAPAMQPEVGPLCWRVQHICVTRSAAMTCRRRLSPLTRHPAHPPQAAPTTPPPRCRCR